MTLNETMTVPHLTTALTGPFQDLEQQMLDNQILIESWFRNADLHYPSEMVFMKHKKKNSHEKEVQYILIFIEEKK